MLDLKPTIERISHLLDEGTEQSVTYAALEARLALERVCYDRLRQSHDYISHAQLKRWQPGSVVQTLMEQVDPHVTNTRTLKVSLNAVNNGAEPKDDDFVELGTEIGFDAKKISQMWQALANLALHVRLPEHKDDAIPTYGDLKAIQRKVGQVLQELKRLSATTMTFSGIGKEVRFDCDCGESNRRRAELLNEGQSVYCINPNCLASWTVKKEGTVFWFSREELSVKCIHCGEENSFDIRDVMKMKKNEIGRFSCDHCKGVNGMMWRLFQAKIPATDSSSDEVV